jgi:ATP/maltotriose-dependent transcriptional regulator MalT
MMLDPPLYGATQYYSLIAEMFLAAGMPEKAGIALDGADRFADAHGERFAECLRLLLRARVLHAQGEPVAVVRAAAAKAKTVSAERRIYVVARRADDLMSQIRTERAVEP